MWSIHTAERHSAPERKDVLTPGTAWTGLEDMVLSEASQSQKGRDHVTPRTGGPGRSRVHRDGGGVPG